MSDRHTGTVSDCIDRSRQVSECYQARAVLMLNVLSSTPWTDKKGPRYSLLVLLPIFNFCDVVSHEKISQVFSLCGGDVDLRTMLLGIMCGTNSPNTID